ncbi:MAG TPA: glycosyltransferase family 39 protein [Vitreimonas sp.]|nr:glycosyltransferase family 39 protein [Vitreimonas sp.]
MTTTAQEGDAGRPGFGRGLGRPVRAVQRHVGAFFTNPTNVLGVILLAALGLRSIWLWVPEGQLIFDEAYYVNAARVLLGEEVGAGAKYHGAPLGLDPNHEHPPLGKVLIAGSMLLFGDGGVGWRLPSLIASMVALAAVYGIVRGVGETAWLGTLAVGLFAADNLALVHSRIGTLDMLALAPLLVGAWLATQQRWALAGIACAVGSLVKLTGAFGLLALLILQVFALTSTWRRTRRLGFDDLRPALLMTSAYGVVAIGGLWLLDLVFTAYRDPWAHLGHMMAFGSRLQAPEGPTGIASNPWQWLVNEVQINYMRVGETVRSNGEVIATRPRIDFRGALNPALIGALPLAFLFAGWLAVRRRSRLAVWAVVWAAANYLPFYVLVILSHRITYLYYFLPVVPALAIAVALLLRRARLPDTVTWGYLAVVAAGFAAYFPFRRLP